MGLRTSSENQRGSLLLDTLTAILILTITFAVGYPNYMRGVYEANVTIDAAQLDAINIAVIRYATDHNGMYPASGTPITASAPGPTYLSEVPTSPIGPNGYAFGAAPVGGAPYVIIDTNTFSGSNQTDPALIMNSYRHADMTPCSSTDMLAVDNMHGTYCAKTGD